MRSVVKELDEKPDYVLALDEERAVVCTYELQEGGGSKKGSLHIVRGDDLKPVRERISLQAGPFHD